MRGQEIARIFAAQTAIIALLVEILIDANLVSKEDLKGDLYAMLKRFVAEGGTDQQAGPIRHLISLVDQL